MNQEKREESVVFKVGKRKDSRNLSYRVAWNKQHDSKLLSLVQFYKGRNWKRIAQEMQATFHDSELSAKKCRERWCNCTNPEIDKSSLTECEELFLLIYHHEYKNKWVLISQHLPHRNSSKLKNNFSSLIRKVARKIGLNERSTSVTSFEYAQIMYATVLISDLASIENSPEQAVALAPIHIYEHIKKRSINRKQCVDYLKKTTEKFLQRHTARKALHKLLALDNIDAIKIFLKEFITAVKARCASVDALTEEALLAILEKLLSAGESVPTPEPIHPLPVLSRIPPIKNFPSAFIMRPPRGQYESEVPPIPELQNWNFPLMQPNFSPSPLLNFPLSTFSSPAFQHNLLSSQSQLFSTSTNHLFSPNYYLPIAKSGGIQIMEPPEKPFMVGQKMPSILENSSRMHGGSDFSLITDKFIQH